jgi:pimeloyl-ACP methyl ester carboxylesterase
MRKILVSFVAFSASACVHGQDNGPAMQRATLQDGSFVEYTVRGAGAPLLLIHGTAAANALSLIYESPALDAFQVILMHRRGYAGSSRLAGPFSMSDQANDALAVLDALDVDSAHIAGHSYGTSVGMQMAVEAPDRVSSLILIDMVPPPGLLPPPAQDPDAGQQAADDPSGVLIDVQRQLVEGSVTVEEAIATVFDIAMGPDWPEFFEAIDSYEQTVADFASAFPIEGQAMGEWQSNPLDFGAISLPIMVVWGENQWQHPLSLSQAFQQAVPQTELRPIAGADHASIVQKPDEIAHAIAEFISGQ